MQLIFTLLQELDRLYTSDTLAEYETAWKRVVEQVQGSLPGFTIAYAEIYNAGETREPLGSIRHVLVPIERNAR